MFTSKRFAIAAVVAIGCLATGCIEMTLPRFDGGVLNPEIRLLRAGEIMESVKCAMISFMDGREKKLHREREEAFNRLPPSKSHKRCPPAKNIDLTKKTEPYCQLEGESFSPDHINVSKKVEQSFYPLKREGNTWATQYFKCPKGSHWSWKLCPAGQKTCKEGQLTQGCVDDACEPQLNHTKNGGYDLRMGASIWDYTVTVGSASVKEKGCVAVPEYSRFALDPNQNGTIQLTLLGVNSGFINYNRIDAVKTPFYPFIQPGNSAAGFPFPQLQISPKATTTFDMSVAIPQSVHLYHQTAVPSDRIIEPVTATTEAKGKKVSIKRLKKKEETSALSDTLLLIRKQQLEARNAACRETFCTGGVPKTKKQYTAWAISWKSHREGWKIDLCGQASAYVDSMSESDAAKKAAKEAAKQDVEAACEIFDNQLNAIAAQLPDSSPPKQALANEYEAKCRPDHSTLYLDGDTRIDFLALKRMLDNVVDKQEQAVHRGIPDLTLSSLNLSSAFQITMEAQAGTKHFFRIVPVLVPPNTDLKLDHTHTLKVSLNGKKNKDPQSAKRLVESCRERVSPPLAGSGDTKMDACTTEVGQLLEGVIQALERAGGSSQ